MSNKHKKSHTIKIGKTLDTLDTLDAKKIDQETSFELKVKGQRVRNVNREAYERQLGRKLEDPNHSLEQRTVLKAFCESYRTKQGKPLSINAKLYYMLGLRKLFYFLKKGRKRGKEGTFQATKLQEVTRKDIDAFFDDLGKQKTKRGELTSERTIQNFRLYIRAFFRWYYLKYLAPEDNNKAEKARLKEIFSDLFEEWYVDTKAIRTTPVREEDLITDEEFEQMMKHAGSIRNQAFFMMLRESAARIEEVQNLRIQDVKQTPNTYDISVIGAKDRKERVIPIPETRPYLLGWLRVHPFSNDPKAPLWISRPKWKTLAPLSPDALRGIIRKTATKAGLNKRIHPHIFRHKRLTELAIDEDMPLSLLKEISGHYNTTVLEKIYVQSSQRKARERIYEAKGIDLSGKEPETKAPPKECPSCHEVNKAKARFCSRCGSPMDLVSALDLRESKKRAGLYHQVLINLIKANPELYKQLEENGTLKELKRLEESS